ncbi:MAG: hypothetical protein AB1720_06145 [Pseudomonadota bacterium]
MAADQAAGLRRRQAGRPARSIHCVSALPAASQRLLDALARQGRRTLLIDVQGRQFAGQVRSLFDWRQQLARGQLQTLALPGGDGWHAPGIEADAPELAVLAAHYDCLVFDHPLESDKVAVPLAGRHILVLDVAQAQLKPAYRLLKTLAHHDCDAAILLLGEAAACARLEAACRQFLDGRGAQRIGSLAHETDAFAALASRMAEEETGPRAVA